MRHEEHVNENCFVTDVPTAAVCKMKTFQIGIVSLKIQVLIVQLQQFKMQDD